MCIRENKKKKVLILSLSDKYWSDFAYDFSLRLNEWADVYIAFESRLGGYIATGGAREYVCGKHYYFSDYVRDNKNVTLEPRNINLGYCDFLRQNKINKKLSSYTDWVRYTSLLTGFFEEIISDNSIEVVIHEAVSTPFSLIAEKICMEIGVKYLGFISSRLPGHFEVRQCKESCSDTLTNNFFNLTKKIDNKEIEWVENYICDISKIVPDYMINGSHNNSGFSGIFTKKNFVALIGAIKYAILENEDSKNTISRPPVSQYLYYAILRKLIRPIRKFKNDKLFYFPSDEFLKKKKYLVFPLHLQPESSTTVYGTYFEDQLKLVEQLSFTLPDDYLLLVKEHTSNVGFLSSESYKRIKLLPRTLLVSYKVNMKSLIGDSCGVVTISSTAGYEAVIMRKPVFLFGDVFYENHPLCIKLNAVKDIVTAIQKINSQRDFCDSNLVEYNKRFILAYKHYCRNGVVDYQKKEFNIGESLEAEIINA